MGLEFTQSHLSRKSVSCLTLDFAMFFFTSSFAQRFLQLILQLLVTDNSAPQTMHSNVNQQCNRQKGAFWSQFLDAQWHLSEFKHSSESEYCNLHLIEV